MNEVVYLDTIQAAAMLRLSKRTLERWRLEARGPRYLKFGARVVYTLQDLNSWAEEQRKVPAFTLGNKKAQDNHL